MGKKPKQYASVHAEQNVSDAFATILRHNLAALTKWQGAAQSWEDIEGIHQVRVALRRLRSALTVFRFAIPRTTTEGWAKQMRQFASALGPARDLDVFIAEGLLPLTDTLPLPGAKRLTALAERQRALAYDEVRALLVSREFRIFKKEFRAWLAAQGWRTADATDRERARLDSKIGRFARRTLDKRVRKVVKTGRAVDPDSAQDMHRLRIQCKKLRYAAEFFLPLFTGTSDFIAHMKKLQDLLGMMHDVAVMPALLDKLLEQEQDLEVQRYAGVLIGWRAREYHELRDTFQERWDELAGAPHPWEEKPAAGA